MPLAGAPPLTLTIRRAHLLKALSPDDPCGPDLDEQDDPEFRNYVGAAELRVPDSFFESRSDQADFKPVQLQSELDNIDGLLDRSRHLRLLILEARLQAFFGSLEGFAEAVMTIAALLKDFWDEVHPRGENGDFLHRANLVRSLEDVKQVIIPLQHRVLLRDRTLGPFTMRQQLLASGAVQPRSGEEVGDAASIKNRLGAAENTDAAAALKEQHAAVSATAEALAGIRATFIEKSGYDFAPSFDRLTDFLTKTRLFIEDVRPEIAEAAAIAEPAPVAASAAEGGTEPAPATAMTAAVAHAGATAIPDTPSAAAALLAAERYFAAYEPSAPALVLVHQARMLIGRPLVEILATLLPEAAETAAISFAAPLKFSLPMPVIRSLTEEAMTAEPSEPAAAPQAFSARSRIEAVQLMAGVQAFLQRAEPSSPVPLLLRRALEWLDKDFAALLRELLPAAAG